VVEIVCEPGIYRQGTRIVYQTYGSSASPAQSEHGVCVGGVLVRIVQTIGGKQQPYCFAFGLSSSCHPNQTSPNRTNQEGARDHELDTWVAPESGAAVARELDTGGA
jgi:hypothetical protein